VDATQRAKYPKDTFGFYPHYTRGQLSNPMTMIRLYRFSLVIFAGLSLPAKGNSSIQSASALSNPSSPLTTQKRFKLVQVQIIHRHGDRTPITPMADAEFWRGTLPAPTLLSKMAKGTDVLTNDENGQTHAAAGIGPFGKLTQLGIFQMVEVGSRIREELQLNDEEEEESLMVGEDGHIHINRGRLFTKMDPIHPSKVKIKSTNFPRTIQSVQALLLGLFPDGFEGTLEIDARHTDILIPDPQPRLSSEQIDLERTLSQRPHLLKKEEELKDLAAKVSKDLVHLVDGDNVHSANFGIGEESEKQKNLLSFSQMAEVLTCLKIRSMLPESITETDCRTITSHSAWKWIENLRDERLAQLAMKSFMNIIMKNLNIEKNKGEQDDTKCFIYSCHDSSLIGLMCAFKLEQPEEWPEYGSFIKVELFEVDNSIESGGGGNGVENKYFVRFSLNGAILQTSWGLDENMVPADMICLESLNGSIDYAHGPAVNKT